MLGKRKFFRILKLLIEHEIGFNVYRNIKKGTINLEVRLKQDSNCSISITHNKEELVLIYFYADNMMECSKYIRKKEYISIKKTLHSRTVYFNIVFNLRG